MRLNKLIAAGVLSAILIFVGFWAGPAQAGGWAVVTLEDLPGEVVAGRPFRVYFAVRQHGQHLMPGLSPTIMAVNSETNERVSAEATETNKTGRYSASITLPAPGQWRWSIEAFTASFTMPPLAVIAASEQAPFLAAPSISFFRVVGAMALVAAAGLAILWARRRRPLWLAGLGGALLLCLGAFSWQGQETPQLIGAEGKVGTAVSAAQMGEALFVAKGCIQCHQNGAVTMAKNPHPIGPDLTKYNASAEFLRLWLADPSRVKPKTLMPDLELSDGEIESLIAFLNGDGEQLALR